MQSGRLTEMPPAGAALASVARDGHTLGPIRPML